MPTKTGKKREEKNDTLGRIYTRASPQETIAPSDPRKALEDGEFDVKVQYRTCENVLQRRKRIDIV